MREAQRKGASPGFLDLHWRFHHLICEQSGNKFLAQSWNSVSRIIRVYQALARFVVEVVDGLDLSNLTRQYAGHG